MPHARARRHSSWDAFIAGRDPSSRLVLLTTAGTVRLDDFGFAEQDTLLVGRESAGVPNFVHRAAFARIVIPLHAGNRSLNVAQAGAIALYEGMRQTGLLPEL
jgi:tRNA (cytidine/uridine-2'-O-)-methyltransferase